MAYTGRRLVPKLVFTSCPGLNLTRRLAQYDPSINTQTSERSDGCYDGSRISPRNDGWDDPWDDVVRGSGCGVLVLLASCGRGWPP